MGAYAALVSLAQTIDEILNNNQYHPISLHKKGQITSIREHLISFKAFFEEFPDKSNDILEARIRDIALDAEHRISHFMRKQSDQWNKLSDTINSIAREVEDLCLGDDGDDSLPPAAAASSSSSLNFCKREMGAYAALVSLAQTIDHILNHDSTFLSWHQIQQVVSIHEYVIFLQTFLEHFPERSNSSLEGRMTDLANEAEDRITHFIQKQSVKSKQRQRRADKRNKLSDTIKSIARGVKAIKNSIIIQKLRLGDDDSPPPPAAASAPFDDNWHDLIDDNWHELSDTINSITREVKDLCLGDDDDDDSLPPPAAASSSSSLAPSHEKDAMVGFDADLLAIKERLCGESSKLQVIPIVGMGGIGKTTLALNAYNDPLITHCFYIRAWATVSQDYSVSKIISDLQIGGSGQSNELNVYQSLKGRRYLIVMDDIWSTKAWDDVRRIFPEDHNGSRIILTTRLTDVAAYADSSSHLHEMQLMGRDRSWDLLREEVFKQEVCPPELEDVGKEIARSCGGLPLAIVVVAGLLSTVSKTPAQWKKIAKKVNATNIATKDARFENIFYLSYAHLPHHLRACFLFMAVYPEGYKINVSKLIKLWVAEGFIKPSESKKLEEMAEEYLEDLVKRFLVLVSEKKCDGKIKSCRLHDVIRELCIRKAEQEKLLLCVRDTSNLHEESTRNLRRLSIIKQSHDPNCLAKFYGSTIRTLMCFVSGGNLNIYSKHFRFLRISHFEKACNSGGQSAWVAQMFELFHLRYLAFRLINFSFSIPAAITDLQHLQTLIINTKWRSDKVSLPSGIWRMQQLRHLVCYRIDELPNPEEGAICGLENLQTLLEVTNFKCSESIVRMIPRVKKLGIVCSAKKYELENLVHLQHLEKLKITVYGFPEKNVNLAFPRTLKKLSLSGLRLRWDKDMMKIVGSLPNLQVLKLINSHRYWKQWETSEGEFPELKYLLIHNSKLEEWISKSSHFPSLICLQIHYCPRLLEIPDGIGDIPTLELIQLDDCCKSVAESAKRIQEKQQNYGNDVLQVICKRCCL